MKQRAKGSEKPIRLLMYSPGGYGLGHYWRTWKISAFLREELPEVSILIITETSMGHTLHIPPGVDYVKIPCISNRPTQEIYTLPRTGGAHAAKHLSLTPKEMKSLRERIILGTALTYRPHVFLVDKTALGTQAEILPTLRALKERRRRTKVVLGFRDIVDDPQNVKAYFRSRVVADALEKIYDAIWIYGCRSLYDPVQEYGFSGAVAKKMKFCGYLRSALPSAEPKEVRRELDLGGGKFVLVTVGGGRDGFPLLDTYLKALDYLPKDVEVFSLLVSGADMPQRERETLRRRCDGSAFPPLRRVRLLEFTPRFVEYISAADLVVSMGGYNTMMDIISLGKEAVVVPRNGPLLEQRMRAEAFEERGLIRTVRPDQLSPKALAEAIRRAWEPPAEPFAERLARAKIDLNGLASVKHHLLGRLRPRGGGQKARRV